ncbi:MAG: IS5 family transposase [Anaerolineae bacterium]|nr:IS5 family transposase [Anaerolineae bacterium]MBX3080911.1 IS5 family transposase [Anaerolineae bacterium]MBX3085508.1 IS5 family transposase [Anaerolineae bacterium]
MSTIPESVTEDQFRDYILPYLTTARRGYVSKTPLQGIFNLLLYRLHTGCQWDRLPVSHEAAERQRHNQPSWQAVYDHWRKWSTDGSLEKVWQESIGRIKDELDLHQMNLDGSHAIAKKGGESVAYQARKRAKTSNILPITDSNGYVVASTGIIAGNHNDAFQLKAHLQSAFKAMKHIGLVIAGALFNADSAFDTKEARKVCFNHQVVPNMAENKRNRKSVKRGRKRLFNAEVYKVRFVSERSFAWIDKFRALLLRFDRKDANFLAGHHLAFALINLRHLFAMKV